MLIFHPALAPYRIDQFNSLDEMFDLTVVFLFDNVRDNPFNQLNLLDSLRCKYRFLLRGPTFKSGRVFRWGMLDVIRECRPALIISYEFSLTTLFLLLLRLLRVIRVQIGSTIDDNMWIVQKVQNRTRWFARAAAVRRLDYIVVLSGDVGDYYVRQFGVARERVIVSPILQNPRRLLQDLELLDQLWQSNVDRFGLVGLKVLLFVGRLVEEKGVLNFIRMVADQLSKANIFLVIVGDGPERVIIDRFVSERKLSNVACLGRVEGSELRAWYAGASGLVLPSTYEPFGAVVDEALAFGLRVLCSRYAGAACLIDNANGIIFDPLIAHEAVHRFGEFANLLARCETGLLRFKPSLSKFDARIFCQEWQKAMPAVVHLVTSVALGGAENVAFSLAGHFPNSLVVEVFRSTSQYSSEKRKELEVARIRVVSLSSERNWIGILMAITRFFLLLRSTRPAIVHSHTDTPDFVLSCALRLLRLVSGPPPSVVRTIHNVSLWKSHPLVGRFTERAFKSDKVVGVSRAAVLAYRDLRSQYGLPLSDDISVIYSAGGKLLEREPPFSIDSSRINIGFCGRFDRQKGVDILIHQLAEMERSDSGLANRFLFHIIGDGPLRPQVVAVSAGLTCVRLYDAVSNVAHFLHCLDCVIVPSRFEGFGLISVEASYAKVPALVSRAVGLDETLPPDWPLRFELDRPGSLFKVLRGVASGLFDLEELGAVSYEFVSRNFSRAAMFASYNKLYGRC